MSNTINNNSFNYDYLNSRTSGSFFDGVNAAGGSSMGLSGMLGDYASIKNGSYGKLLKAYYAKQESESVKTSSAESKKLTILKGDADSLKKSADALNNNKLFEKKMIKKKDPETGEETETLDYDRDAIAKAVKRFVKDYNEVVEGSGDCDTTDVLRQAVWMTKTTAANERLLAKVGITVGKGNKLEVDEETLKQADISTLKTLFTGQNSIADKISQKAGQISGKAMVKAASSAVTYKKNGDVSKLVDTGKLYDKSE